MDSLPNRIRELRHNACVTQQEIADHIGVTKTTVSELERGLLPFTLKYMRGIAECLAVSPGDLLLPCDNPRVVSEEEFEIIKMLRSADKERCDSFWQLAKVILRDRAARD